MKETNTPLLSAAELEALIQSWGNIPNQSTDRLFPIKFWFVILVAASYSTWLLFAPDKVAMLLATETADIAILSRFLYFRGWFLILMISLAFYHYSRDNYVAIFSSFCFMIAAINFAFDLFNIYGDNLGRPTPGITILLLIRILALSVMYTIVRNSCRLPEVKDRFNILLPFRKNNPEIIKKHGSEH